MNSEIYLEEMKNIQVIILDYLDYESNVEEKYQNLLNFFSKIKIHDNQYTIKSIFQLLIHISNNHHREERFFSKIEQILSLFKDDIKKYFTNSELFHIFKSNKRILLFLFEEKIMKFDKFVAKQIINVKYIDKKYPQYFQPEIKPFLKEKWFPKYDKILGINKWVPEIQKEIPTDFYDNRKKGENNEVICKLIQKDLIEEFIIYVNKYDYPLNSTFNRSIYETNSFLIKKEYMNNLGFSNKITNISLIEYAAFFGSIQIFKYLISNKVELTPSLWLYAIHGKDPEIFHIIEENHLDLPKKMTYEHILKESIKCHHINVSNYIFDNYMRDEKQNVDEFILINSLKYYNFNFIENDKINEKTFIYLCKYDYYILVFNLLNTKNIDINNTIDKIIFIDK